MARNCFETKIINPNISAPPVSNDFYFIINLDFLENLSYSSSGDAVATTSPAPFVFAGRGKGERV